MDIDINEYINNINRLLLSKNISEEINVDTSNLDCLEGKDIIDRNLYNILSNHIEDKHKVYQIISKTNGEDLPDGILVLEKELPTSDMVEVMYYNIDRDSIYLYCGIPRYTIYDKDRRPITYFHYLERKLKTYVYENNKIEGTYHQEEYIYNHFYRSYIIEALEKVLDICRENNIKSIRIDCNKSFNNRISSILMELGFVSLPVDYPERINFLKEKYPNYQIPEQLDLLFQRYPDREIAYSELVNDLADRLELIKNMYVEEDYESDNFLENESSMVKDFNNGLMEEEIIWKWKKD